MQAPFSCNEVVLRSALLVNIVEGFLIYVVSDGRWEQ